MWSVSGLCPGQGDFLHRVGMDRRDFALRIWHHWVKEDLPSLQMAAAWSYSLIILFAAVRTSHLAGLVFLLLFMRCKSCSGRLGFPSSVGLVGVLSMVKSLRARWRVAAEVG